MFEALYPLRSQVEDESDTVSCTATGLQSDTDYRFRVAQSCSETRVNSEPSASSETVRTGKDGMQDSKGKKGNVDVYKACVEISMVCFLRKAFSRCFWCLNQEHTDVVEEK